MKTYTSHWFSLFAAAALALGVATASHAAPIGVEVGEVIEASATVVEIDKADRMVTLLSHNGNVVKIEAGEEVRNFDQIEVGDKVKITYYESVAIYLGAPGTQPEADAAAVMVRAAKGTKPGGVAVGAIDVSAKVVAIDKTKRELTLELPDGRVVKNEVDPSVKAFDGLEVGDVIHARITRALAIGVESL